MDLDPELKAEQNECRQKKAGFRRNKKVDDCRIAGHVQACVKSERAFQAKNGNSEWDLWIDIHEVAKACAKHAHDVSSLYGDYFENGRITRGEAEIRQLHDFARQMHPQGYVFGYGLKPMKDGTKHLCIIAHKHALRTPWGSTPRITREIWNVR